jgi:putative SOS response-associated peptidase YedK
MGKCWKPLRSDPEPAGCVRVHDRMPVILAPDHYDRWLDLSIEDVNSSVSLLRPFASNLMRRYPVSTRVNLVANDDPECSAPADLPSVPVTLFD